MNRPALRQHWAWVVTLVVLLGLYRGTDAALVDTRNPNLVPSMLLLGSLVVPATFVSFARGWSGRQIVPAATLWTAVLVGGAVGVVIAGVLEYNTVRRLGEIPMLGVGLIEEGTKLAVAAVFLLVLRRYTSMGAGILIGIAVGTGFAVLETMGYGFVTLIQSGGNVGSVEQTLFVRGVTSPAGHAAWTGLTCWGLWRFWHHPTGRRLFGFAGLFVVAVVLHATWDTIGTPSSYVLLAVLSLGLLFIALRQARRADERLVADPAPAGVRPSGYRPGYRPDYQAADYREL
jgi:RsiW-degrading membrane proteinase PrsW (M82 family)